MPSLAILISSPSVLSLSFPFSLCILRIFGHELRFVLFHGLIERRDLVLAMRLFAQSVVWHDYLLLLAIICLQG